MVFYRNPNGFLWPTSKLSNFTVFLALFLVCLYLFVGTFLMPTVFLFMEKLFQDSAYCFLLYSSSRPDEAERLAGLLWER